MHTEELVFLPPTFVLGNDEESDFVRCYVGECMDIAMMNFVVAQGCLASVVLHLEILKAHLQSTKSYGQTYSWLTMTDAVNSRH